MNFILEFKVIVVVSYRIGDVYVLFIILNLFSNFSSYEKYHKRNTDDVITQETQMMGQVRSNVRPQISLI